MAKVQTDKSGKPIQLIVAWVIAILSLGYMIPWAIAATRGKANSGAIGVLNLLLGWTLIGWIVALVMACGSHQVVAAPAIAQPRPQTPAGWYAQGDVERYWNGVAWTEQTRPVA